MLIGKSFVLTSAQCCNLGQLKYVHFGKDKMKNTRLSGVYDSGNAKRVHPGYDDETLNNDLCIIHYSADVQYGPKIQPICMQTELPEVGHNLWVAGYGASIEGSD